LSSSLAALVFFAALALALASLLTVEPASAARSPPRLALGRHPLLVSARFETPAVRSDRRKNPDLSKII
jgi:hypothetical protein